MTITVEVADATARATHFPGLSTVDETFALTPQQSSVDPELLDPATQSPYLALFVATVRHHHR